MDITFDQAKSVANLKKHGLTLGDAGFIDWDTLMTKKDVRREYAETRMIGYAFIGERLHCVVYTDRGNKRRIISLRKANNRELEDYVSDNEIR